MRRIAAFTCSLTLFAACSSSDDGTTGTDAGGSTTVVATVAAAPDTTQPSTEPATTQPATTSTEPPVVYAQSIEELLAIGRPIVLAHTAGEDEFPASTMFAFGESVKAGVDMLDMNVLLTKDGVLVVQHDDTVDRATNGTGAVADLTYAEIEALDNAYWFTADCGACTDQPAEAYLYRGIRTGDQPAPNGYTADDFAIPTFRQLVERYPDIPLNIEIKGEGAPAMAAADVLEIELAELGRSQASVVASFDDTIVAYFHTVAPDVEVSPGLSVLTAYVLDATPLPDGMRILQLPPEFSGLQVITPQLVARATTDGNPIWVWPNDRELENLEAYRDFLEQGIVGLNINFPALGVQAVHEFVATSSIAGIASAGCDTEVPAPAGETTVPLDAAGLSGTFIQHLPPAYDGATPLPVVLGLHGWSQPANLLAIESALPAAADRNRFIAIVPDIARPVALWDTALDGADVAWVTSLLDTIEATLCIDSARIYVTGMSNGAMMTSTLACVLADRVAAVAPVAGVRDPEGCQPTRAVPMVAFHGTDDPYLAFEGGYGPKVAGLPTPDGTGTIGDAAIAGGQDGLPVPDRVAAWAGRNGCAGTFSETVVADDVTLTDWVDCGAGATRLYTIEGGGHSWPGSTFDGGIVNIVGPTTASIVATDIMWRFFREHPLAG